MIGPHGSIRSGVKSAALRRCQHPTLRCVGRSSPLLEPCGTGRCIVYVARLSQSSDSGIRSGGPPPACEAARLGSSTLLAWSIQAARIVPMGDHLQPSSATKHGQTEQSGLVAANAYPTGPAYAPVADRSAPAIETRSRNNSVRLAFVELGRCAGSARADAERDQPLRQLVGRPGILGFPWLVNPA